jgi:hypothetical protein
VPCPSPPFHCRNRCWGRPRQKGRLTLCNGGTKSVGVSWRVTRTKKVTRTVSGWGRMGRLRLDWAGVFWCSGLGGQGWLLITMSLDCFSPETLFGQQPNMPGCRDDCRLSLASGGAACHAPRVRNPSAFVLAGSQVRRVANGGGGGAHRDRVGRGVPSSRVRIRIWLAPCCLAFRAGFRSHGLAKKCRPRQMFCRASQTVRPASPPPFFATSSPRSVNQSLGTGSHAGLMGFMASCIPVGARFVVSVSPEEETGFRPPTQSAAGRGPSGRPPTKRPPARSCSVQPVCLPARMPSAKSDPAVVVSATSSRSPQ